MILRAEDLGTRRMHVGAAIIIDEEMQILLHRIKFYAGHVSIRAAIESFFCRQRRLGQCGRLIIALGKDVPARQEAIIELENHRIVTRMADVIFHIGRQRMQHVRHISVGVDVFF